MEYRSLLIADTTKEERARIVEESLGSIEGGCDGCAQGVIEMYDRYIEGEMELSEVNAAYRAHFCMEERDEKETGFSCAMG